MKTYMTHIKAKTGWFDIDLKELFQYKDLIWLFVKRNYSIRYKQTILGPLWLILNPLLTVTLYALVFGNIAGMSTDGAPQFAFYLCSNAIWSYFACCITETSNTFTVNAAIMGKVYFPRLVMPISAVITGLLDMLIQLAMLCVVIVGYLCIGVKIQIDAFILLVPIITLQVAMLGLGCGIIIAALTTKYRDLVVLVSFGVQLWMYASPVVYSINQMDEGIRSILLLNPMAPIITVWRRSLLGIGNVPWGFWGISWGITVLLLAIGVILFSKVEKTFMDTV